LAPETAKAIADLIPLYLDPHCFKVRLLAWEVTGHIRRGHDLHNTLRAYVLVTFLELVDSFEGYVLGYNFSSTTYFEHYFLKL